MFDMRKSAERRQVLMILGFCLLCACIPALLVLASQMSGRLFYSILAGVALYFIFFRKSRKADTGDEETVQEHCFHDARGESSGSLNCDPADIRTDAGTARNTAF